MLGRIWSTFNSCSNASHYYTYLCPIYRPGFADGACIYMAKIVLLSRDPVLHLSYSIKIFLRSIILIVLLLKGEGDIIPANTST